MIEVRNKEALSPIIATVLLIAISLSLAAIIFIWAYDFFGESIEKQGRIIDQSCEEVRFEAEVNGNILSIKNAGDIPLHGFEIKIKKNVLGDIIKIEEPEKEIGVGESADIPLEQSFNAGGEIIVSPVLLGEDEESYKKYVCDDRYGQVVEI